MRTFLVTGGAGYIGSHAAKALRTLGTQDMGLGGDRQVVRTRFARPSRERGLVVREGH